MKGESPQELAGGVRALLARARPLELGRRLARYRRHRRRRQGHVQYFNRRGADRGRRRRPRREERQSRRQRQGRRRRRAGAVRGAASSSTRRDSSDAWSVQGSASCSPRIIIPRWRAWHRSERNSESGRLFNLLGPIANAARPARKLVGVAESAAGARDGAGAGRIGRRPMRWSCIARTEWTRFRRGRRPGYFEVRGGHVTESLIRPADFGIKSPPPLPLSALKTPIRRLRCCARARAAKAAPRTTCCRSTAAPRSMLADGRVAGRGRGSGPRGFASGAGAQDAGADARGQPRGGLDGLGAGSDLCRQTSGTRATPRPHRPT